MCCIKLPCLALPCLVVSVSKIRIGKKNEPKRPEVLLRVRVEVRDEDKVRDKLGLRVGD